MSSDNLIKTKISTRKSLISINTTLIVNYYGILNVFHTDNCSAVVRRVFYQHRLGRYSFFKIYLWFLKNPCSSIIIYRAFMIDRLVFRSNQMVFGLFCYSTSWSYFYPTTLKSNCAIFYNFNRFTNMRMSPIRARFAIEMSQNSCFGVEPCTRKNMIFEEEKNPKI